MMLDAEKEPQFSQPIRQILLMVVVLIATGFGAFLMYSSVADVFLANIYLNGVIVGVFVIGVLAALSPRFLNSLFEWRAWMPYAAAVALLLQPYSNPEQDFATGMAMLFANQLAMWTLVLFILQFFNRFFSEGGPRTTWLADCALSMYLFHHCFIYIYGQMFVGVDWPIALEFTLLTLLSAGTVIAIHELLVRRFALVRLLANGKTDVEQVRKQPGVIEAFFGRPAKRLSKGAGKELSPS